MRTTAHLLRRSLFGPGLPVNIAPGFTSKVEETRGQPRASSNNHDLDRGTSFRACDPRARGVCQCPHLQAPNASPSVRLRDPIPRSCSSASMAFPRPSGDRSATASARSTPRWRSISSAPANHARPGAPLLGPKIIRTDPPRRLRPCGTGRDSVYGLRPKLGLTLAERTRRMEERLDTEGEESPNRTISVRAKLGAPIGALVRTKSSLRCC